MKAIMHNSLAAYATRAIRRPLQRFVGGDADGIAGVAAVEFALIGPMLVLMMLCTVDLGMGFYRNMQVQTAAQAGAQYAVAHGFTESGVLSAIQSATTFSGISASPGPSQYCGCASSTGIASAVCGSTCPGGSLSGTYVSVSTQATYTTLLPYPTLPNSFALTARSTVRIQ